VPATVVDAVETPFPCPCRCHDTLTLDERIAGITARKWKQCCGAAGDA
jgi:hypothetical protein